MATVEITWDGTDIAPLVLFGTASFESQVNGRGGTCRFRIRDLAGTATYVAGTRVTLLVDGDPVWTGYATAVKRVYVFPAIDLSAFGSARFFDIEGVDINILFQRRIVFNQDDPDDVFGTLFPVNTSDITAIEDLLANFLDLTGDDLDTSSGVTNVGDITIDQKGRAWTGSDRWGDAMTSIGRIPGAIFYLRPDRTLVYTDDDTVDAPFGLSDQPDEFFKSYREMEILVDGTGLANDVFGWGLGYGSSSPVFRRITDTDSVNVHGLWQQAETYFGTFKQATLDRNVESIIYGSPLNLRGAKDDKIAVTLATFDPGFLPAMKVDFRSYVWGEVASTGLILPIRKMVVTFPTPDTPKYELTLSHEIDTPFNLIDNLLFNFHFPPPPPFPPFPIPPLPPPPPAPISCGITDTYNRATTDYSENALGQADCGRSYESGEQAIQGNRGQGYGPLNLDAPPGVSYSWTMPGPWPVPFGGGIVLVDADTFPGFTAETDPSQTFPTGWAWRTGSGFIFGKAYFDGTSAVVPPYNHIQLGFNGGGLTFVAEPALEITGHLRLVETVDTNGLELDDYIDIGIGTSSLSPTSQVFDAVALIHPIGTLGDGRTELAWPGFYPADGPPCEFPAHFWRDNPGGVDFTITWPGGYGDWPETGTGKVITVTVGPCSIRLFVREGQRLRQDFVIANGSAWDDDPENTYATMYVDDPVLINDLTIDSPLSWLWRIEGGLDVDEHTLRYEFAYLGYGAQWVGFPNQCDTGDVPFEDAGALLSGPGLVGPYIAVKISDLTAGTYSVAWAMVDPISFPALPYVSIDSFGATLRIGASSVTATALSAIDPETGDSAPMGLLVELNGDLTQFAGTDQGTYFAYDDLNITGVNACTEGVIDTGVNWLSTWFIADGSDTFTLAGPFLRGTAAVYINGYRQRQVIDYIESPEAGTITFSTAPSVGAVIIVSYYPVGPS